MRRLTLIAALVALLAAYATDMRELRAPAQRGDDWFEFFMAEDGDRESGSRDGREYWALVPDDGRAWGPVYSPSTGPEPEPIPPHFLVLYALAPEAETPEVCGWVGGSIFYDEIGPESAYEGRVVIDASPFPGFTFSHWWNENAGYRVDEAHHTYTFNAGSPKNWTWIAYFDGTGSYEPDTNEYVTVSATVAEDGGGTVEGGGTVIKGREFAVTAYPDASHLFDRWTEGLAEVSRSASYSGTADRDRSFVAHFRNKPRRITCNVNETFEDEYGWAINEAWIASAGERSYGEDTHTVEAFDGERVTIMARVRPKPNAVVIRNGWSSKGKYANHDDSWTLTHTFTVDGDENWLVFFAEQKAEILCDRGGTILHKATNGMILRLKD